MSTSRHFLFCVAVNPWEMSSSSPQDISQHRYGLTSKELFFPHSRRQANRQHGHHSRFTEIILVYGLWCPVL